MWCSLFAAGHNFVYTCKNNNDSWWEITPTFTEHQKRSIGIISVLKCVREALPHVLEAVLASELCNNMMLIRVPHKVQLCANFEMHPKVTFPQNFSQIPWLESLLQLCSTCYQCSNGPGAETAMFLYYHFLWSQLERCKLFSLKRDRLKSCLEFLGALETDPTMENMHPLQ